MIKRKRLSKKNVASHIRNKNRTGTGIFSISLLIIVALVVFYFALKYYPVTSHNSYSASSVPDPAVHTDSLFKKISLLENRIAELNSLIEKKQTAASPDRSATSTSVRTTPAPAKPTLSLKRLKIQILNGCGEDGIAEQFKSFLESKDAKIIDTGNYKHFKVKKSFVICQKSGDPNAKLLAQALTLSTKSIQYRKAHAKARYIFVIGKDYKSLPPFKKNL